MKRILTIVPTPVFCLAAIVLFLLEIAERRFLLIGRFFPANRKKPADADASGAVSAMTGKAPRKRGKAARKPAAGSGPSAAVPTHEEPAEARETAAAQEPPAADSISAALKRARRR